MPPDAVVGGNDVDGAVMYVGRAFHNGDMLVAKVLPTKNTSYVSWRGEEIAKFHYEVLCSRNVEWRHCYNHLIPEAALSCGNTALGQPVYIGRGHYEGSLTVGKVSSVHRSLFIPFGGAERRLETYDILVVSQDDKFGVGWAVPPIEYVPPPPPVFDIKPIIPPPMPMPTVPVYPPMPSPSPYEPPPAYTPSPSPYPPPQQPPYHGGYAPPPPPSSSEHFNNPPPPHQGYPPPPQHGYHPPPPPHHPSTVADVWVNTNGNYMPPNAIHAGHDADLSTIFVGRAFHAGDLIPGKVIPNRFVAYVCHGGQEVAKDHCEVLVGDQHAYMWVGSANGRLVPGSVLGGRTATGEPLYVGRAHFAGTLTPGKIQCSHNCLYIAYAGQEHRIQNYEVLVRKSMYYSGQSHQMLY